MAFHAPAFLFLFWPVCALACFAAARPGRGWAGARAARAVLVVASLAFYAWGRPAHLPVLLASLAGNYAACAWMWRRREQPAVVQRVRALAIAANLVWLGLFKYGGLGLPVGISFFTFMQIGVLFDVSAGKVEPLAPLDYCALVTFFPQLLSGPIVRHAELMPQLQSDDTFRPRAANFSVGISLFVIGLFKKVVLADGLAGAAAPSIFAAARAVDARAAWAMTLAYTLQIYFDFSGYSDMALGAARVLGVRLPINFNSPFKAPSFVEYWRRWHITLYRFLMSYVYNPILLALGRRAADSERLPFVVPTLATLLVSGLWHGAGLQFVAWGLLHGCYLVANQAWRHAAPRASARLRRTAVGRAAGVAVTFAAVVLSNALFRAPDLRTGVAVMGAMLGLTRGAPFPLSRELPLWLAAGMAIVWLLPNSQEVLGAHLDAGGKFARPLLPLRWSPTVTSALAVAALAMAALWSLPERGAFAYFAF